MRQLKSQQTRPRVYRGQSVGTLVAEHVLAYNPNGHKTSDTSRVMDADDHASYLDVTTAYSYDRGIGWRR